MAQNESNGHACFWKIAIGAAKSRLVPGGAQRLEPAVTGCEGASGLEPRPYQVLSGSSRNFHKLIKALGGPHHLNIAEGQNLFNL